MLGNGKNLDGDFESGRLTLIGDYDNYKYTEADDPENPSGTLSYDIKDCTLYFTKNVTAYEKYSIEQELYEYGKQVLDEKSKPTYTFSIDSGNFLYDKDFTSFKNALQLGKRVYLRLGDDDNVITPYVTGVEWDFEDPSSFTLEFSDTYTSSDKSFKLAKLLEQSVSMGKKLDLKGGAYNSFVNSGASTFVKRFMDSALDLAKNRVLSSGNQAIEFGDAGIRVRQWSDDTHTSYDDEQLWIVDNMIAFTKDNWATSNMAIGKIFDENIIGTNGTKGATAYGIAAPYLVGTVLAGRNASIHWVQPIVISLCGKCIVSDKNTWLNAPDAYISKALCLALVDAATGGTRAEYAGRATDHWARNNLDSLCDKSIIATPHAWDDDFEGTVTRGNFLALVCKAFGI